MAGIRIKSNNFNGESVEITFNPFSGGTIDLGTQTIPYDYLSSNYEGNYSIYIPSADKTCPLQVGVAPSPTPSITPTNTQTPTPTITPTNTVTPTLTPTPTPSASVPAGDPDANAYLADVVASGGTTDATIEAAVQTLFTDLKSAGLYSKMKAMYPYVGATAASHAINALLDKTFDITWNGGLTHDVSGTTGNGSNGYGNTHITNDVCFSANSKNLSFGYYQNSLNLSLKNESPIGGTLSNYNWVQVYNDATNTNWRVGAFISPGVYAHGGDTSGNYIGSRTGTTGEVVYRNGTQIITKSGDDGISTPNNVEWYVLNFNNGGTPFAGYYSKQRFSFHFASEGLSNTEITTLDGIINTFQTSLGRNTYGGIDPDAQAYLDDVVASGGTIDATITSAVDTLFTDLKSNGLYSKLNVMWPFVGGTASSHAINAKLNKSHDITWNGGMSHGISGSTGNATNGYGITNFSMRDFTTKSISSFGLYLTEPNTDSSGQRLHGTHDASRIAIGTNATGKGFFGFYSTEYNSTQPTDQTGNFSIVRTGTTEAPVYINENTTPFTTLTGTYSSAQPTDPVYLFAYNLNDVVLNNSYTNDTIGFCWAGEGLDYSETITLQGIINTFQTSLGRNTY